MHCPKCGNRITDGSNYCGNCGFKQDILKNMYSDDTPKGNKNKKKVILSIILIFVFFIIGYKFFTNSIITKNIYSPKVSKEYKEHEKEIDEIIKNSLVMSPEEVEAQNKLYYDELESQQSDIKGMTKLDKFNAGLNPEDGADTDNDGLTDKEEIEVYGTDPKKKSTAGDLYTDGYKVEHDMDLNTVCDYDGKLIAEGNKCNEVTLYIDDIGDFSAIVEDVTGQWQFSYAESTSAQWLDNLNILKEYRIYNYTGPMDIKLTDVEKETGVSADNICAMFVMSNYANGWNQMLNKDFQYKVEDDALKIEDRIFASGPILILYEDTELAKDNVNLETPLFNGLFDFSDDKAGLFAENSHVHEEGGDVLITFNLFSALTRGRPSIKYTATGDPEEDAAIIDVCIEIAKWLSDADLDNAHVDPLEINSSHCQEISPKMYAFLDGFYRTFFSDFVSANWKNIITIIDTDVVLGMIGENANETLISYTYKNGMRCEYDKEKGLRTIYDANGNIVWSGFDYHNYKEGFDINRDRLPFGNFGTAFDPAGHCAGITQLMNIMNNTHDIQTTGVYTSKKDKNVVFSWNLLNGNDDDNKELVNNKILIDYKNSDFVKSHRKDVDGGSELTGLSQGEYEFINMIEAYQLMVNENPQHLKSDGTTNYDYELINEMVKNLDEGKILGCGLVLYELNSDKKIKNAPDNAMYASGAHAVNIYDYRKVDENTIDFYVYDSNISHDEAYQTGKYIVTESGNEGVFKPFNLFIRVRRKEVDYDHHDTFEFMYQPFPEADYYFSTNQGLYEMSLNPLFFIPNKGFENIEDYIFSVWDETGEVISNKY